MCVPWNEQIEELQDENNRLREELVDAKGRESKLVETLQKLEWCWEEERGIDYSFSLYYCPSCQNEQGDGHKDDCIIAKAFSADGREYAERVKRFEKVAEAAKELLKFLRTNEDLRLSKDLTIAEGIWLSKLHKALAALGDIRR